MTDITEAQKKGRRELLFLVAIFAVPIVIAAILYNTLDKWQITKTKNFGDLVIPAKPLQDIPMTKRNGSPFKFSDMQGKWVLVYIGQAECDQVCERDLYNMRQSRLAQGGELKRIKRLFILTEQPASHSLNRILGKHTDLEVVTTNPTATQSVVEQFGMSSSNDSVNKKGLYIVDPLGNLMMTYPVGYETRGLVQDLSHLLRASQIG